MEANEYYFNLRYCPECGKKLEQNPVSNHFACFLHGDFELLDGYVVWAFTKNLIVRR